MPQDQIKDGAIHVCPLSAVPDVVRTCGASHLMTCLQDEIAVETPPLIVPDRHLRLHIHDIAEPLIGYTAPGEIHVARLIEFAHRIGELFPGLLTAGRRLLGPLAGHGANDVRDGLGIDPALLQNPAG